MPPASEPVEIAEDMSAVITAWKAFVHYVVKLCHDGYMIADVSILASRNIPIAWRVTTQPIPAFYCSQDGGESGDVQKQWSAFSRHLLSKCAANNGLALVDAGSVVIHKGRPILWVEAQVRRIYPSNMGVHGGEGETIASKILYPNYINSANSV